MGWNRSHFIGIVRHFVFHMSDFMGKTREPAKETNASLQQFLAGMAGMLRHDLFCQDSSRNASSMREETIVDDRGGDFELSRVQTKDGLPTIQIIQE
jgi:hypothetical protein